MADSQAAVLRRLRRLADAAGPQARLRLERALESLQNVPLADLERAIARQDAFALHQLTAGLPAKLQAAVKVLEDVVVKAARAAAPSVGLTLDAPDLMAAQAARAYGATLVTNVATETKAAIREVVSRALAEGITPRDAARLIKPLIGLTRRQAQAAMTKFERAIGAGISRTRALRLLERYAAKQLRERAFLIARTEIIKASTEGQLATWQSAMRRGLLPQTARKVWIVTFDDRLCRFCRPMNGVSVPIGADFTTSQGRRLAGPPLHPACRCAVGISFAVRAA